MGRAAIVEKLKCKQMGRTGMKVQLGEIERENSPRKEHYARG